MIFDAGHPVFARDGAPLGWLTDRRGDDWDMEFQVCLESGELKWFHTAEVMDQKEAARAAVLEVTQKAARIHARFLAFGDLPDVSGLNVPYDKDALARALASYKKLERAGRGILEKRPVRLELVNAPLRAHLGNCAGRMRHYITFTEKILYAVNDLRVAWGLSPMPGDFKGLETGKIYPDAVERYGVTCELHMPAPPAGVGYEFVAIDKATGLRKVETFKAHPDAHGNVMISFFPLAFALEMKGWSKLDYPRKEVPGPLAAAIADCISQ